MDTNNEPFFNDSGRGTAGGSGDAHFVTITDYDEKTGNVYVDNQWNKAADHGQGNPINVHDMFIAMNPPQYAEWLLKQDVDWNRAHGIVDTTKEVDLIRHELKDGTITSAEAEKETKAVLDEMIKRRQQGKLNNEEDVQDWKEINAVIHQLEPGAQARLVKQAHDGQLIGDVWYKEELKLIGYQLIHEASHDKSTAGNRKMMEYYYQQEFNEFYRDLSDLSEDDGREVMAAIQDRIKLNP